MGGCVVDDAFIYLRVADRLLAGDGWVYNRGEPLNPCTSPLYALALASLRAVRVPPVLSLELLYGVGLAALSLVQYHALRTAIGRPLAIAVALVTSMDTIVRKSFGLETSLFLACVASAAWAFDRGRLALAGLFAGLTALGRPEGLAMVVLLVAAEAYLHRRIGWRIAAGFAAVTVPWLLFAARTFGSIVPHTVAVKSLQTHIGWWATQPSWGTAFARQAWIPWLTLAAASVGVFWVFRRISRGGAYAALCVGFGLTQAAAYAVFGAPVGYFWYFAPANLAANMALFGGWFAATRDTRLGGTVGALVAAAGVCVFGAAPLARVGPYRLGAEYRAVGEWINANTSAESRVACVEIGALGYYADRYVVDIHGLLQPAALRSLRAQEWNWWTKINPPADLVVVHEPPWTGEPSPQWGDEAWKSFSGRFDRVMASGTVAVFRRNGRP